MTHRPPPALSTGQLQSSNFSFGSDKADLESTSKSHFRPHISTGAERTRPSVSPFQSSVKLSTVHEKADLGSTSSSYYRAHPISPIFDASGSQGKTLRSSIELGDPTSPNSFTAHSRDTFRPYVSPLPALQLSHERSRSSVALGEEKVAWESTHNRNFTEYKSAGPPQHTMDLQTSHWQPGYDSVTLTSSSKDHYGKNESLPRLSPSSESTVRYSTRSNVVLGTDRLSLSSTHNGAYTQTVRFDGETDTADLLSTERLQRTNLALGDSTQPFASETTNRAHFVPLPLSTPTSTSDAEIRYNMIATHFQLPDRKEAPSNWNSTNNVSFPSHNVEPIKRYTVDLQTSHILNGDGEKREAMKSTQQETFIKHGNTKENDVRTWEEKEYWLRQSHFHLAPTGADTAPKDLFLTSSSDYHQHELTERPTAASPFSMRPTQLYIPEPNLKPSTTSQDVFQPKSPESLSSPTISHSFLRSSHFKLGTDKSGIVSSYKNEYVPPPAEPTPERLAGKKSLG